MNETSLYGNNRAFDGAFRKGASAARNNQDRSPPYGEGKQVRRFREAWLAGYDSVPRSAGAAAVGADG